MLNRAQRVLLKLYRMMPRKVRRQIVRTAAPSFTVGAICVIHRDDGAQLLVRQAYRDGWGLPGGLIKRGETTADCARREVYEEVSLRIDVVGEPSVVVDPAAQRVDIVYRAKVLSPEEAAAAVPSSPEIDELGWFPPDELPKLQHETISALAARARSERDTGPAGSRAADAGPARSTGFAGAAER